MSAILMLLQFFASVSFSPVVLKIEIFSAVSDKWRMPLLISTFFF